MASNYPEVWHHTKKIPYINMLVPPKDAVHVTSTSRETNQSAGGRHGKQKIKRCSSADQIFPKDIYARKVMIEELKKHVLDHL